MLVIDVREACSPKKTGKGQWTSGVVRELLRRNIPLTLVSDQNLPDEWLPLLQPSHTVRVFSVRGLRWHARVHRFLTTLDGPVYLSTTSYILPAFGSRAIRFATVVHDLIAFRGEPHDKRATLIERLTLARAARRSWKICTLSDSTTRDLRERLPGVSVAIASIGAGPGEPSATWHPQGKHVFSLATLCPRKNQRTLIEAYARLSDALRTRFPLLLAGGRGWGDDDILALATKTPGVEWLGYVSDAQARDLLSGAAVFAYPSFYEGFGLPVLDAMHAGVPVLTTTAGSLKEVAGDAAILVDPGSVESVTEGLTVLLTDEEVRKRCSLLGLERSKRYSWKHTVDLLLEHLEIDNLA